MSKLLKDYVKIYPGLSKEFCNQIRKELDEANNWSQHVFYNEKTKTYRPRSGANELDISWADIPSRGKLTEDMWHVIRQYISELNNECFNEWTGYTKIRFNRYTKDSVMAPHVDHIKDIFDGERKGIPILSLIGLLNDDYKGGRLLMFKDEEEVVLKQGDIVVFPSVFLYPHRVDRLTEGIRDSFVTWVW
jgi:predicted 2-oxoglutarate/Fe(II)-dependent dioxygenase YbiX